MYCWACGKRVKPSRVRYQVDDESQRWPLCWKCDKTVDLRLMLMEAQAQGEIDRLAESENVQCL